MKFLLTTRTKEMFYSLPPQTREEVTAGTMAVIERCLKEGKCKEFYERFDMKGCVSIWEINSSEEIATIDQIYQLQTAQPERS